MTFFREIMWQILIWLLKLSMYVLRGLKQFLITAIERRREIRNKKSEGEKERVGERERERERER